MSDFSTPCALTDLIRAMASDIHQGASDSQNCNGTDDWVKLPLPFCKIKRHSQRIWHVNPDFCGTDTPTFNKLWLVSRFYW